jgi:FixJ family two-component response regulator
MTSDHSLQVVAIVDDDQSIQRALKDLMESAELLARCFGSAEEFLESKYRSEIDCLVADVRMPGMSGLELQARLKLEGVRIPVIFITAHSDAKLKREAMSSGAVDFLSKPFDDEVLLDRVRTALGD